jgi:hypothetical protein
MRSPSIAPTGFDVDVYLILDDFGKVGRSYREADEEAADKETIIRNLIEGQYNDPVRIVAFNTAEGWARDVTEDIAREIHDRVERSADEISLLFTHALEVFGLFHVHNLASLLLRLVQAHELVLKLRPLSHRAFSGVVACVCLRRAHLRVFDALLESAKQCCGAFVLFQ